MIKKEKKNNKKNLTNKHLHAKLIWKHFSTTIKLNIRQFKIKQFLA